MRALVFDGTHAKVVTDHPEPARSPTEALIRVRRAGICDTDLQLVSGYMGFRGVLGHEFVGEVLDASDPAWIGRRVVADINAGCGHCAECTAGDGHHCSLRTVLGIVGRDGALADRTVMPERCLVAVPDAVDDDRAVFAEPLAAALHVLDDVDVTRDAPVVVLGDGKLGLLIAAALAASGADPLLVGHHPHKLAIAQALGARTVLESAWAPDESAGAVVEATGSPSGLALALGRLRPRGKLILKTTVAQKTHVDLSPIVIGELSVIGSRCGNLGRAIDLLARGGLDPAPLVAERYSLARADQALSRAGRRGTLKILVDID